MQQMFTRWTAVTSATSQSLSCFFDSIFGLFILVLTLPIEHTVHLYVLVSRSVTLNKNMDDDGNAGDAWVCPNDRQLSLRAKLHFGWSAKSRQIDSATKRPQQRAASSIEPISQAEQERVIKVIQRAEEISENEQRRIGKLVDRVRNIQKNAVGGDGTNQCVLCGDYASVLPSWSGSTRHVTCKDCLKSVCQKCSVDTSIHPREPTYLCKLCSERRETWKKSGAWFYKIN